MSFPRCITAQRIGWGETEYDDVGEQAPVTWRCVCGSSMVLEYLDREEEVYIPVSQALKDEFLANHSNCSEGGDSRA